MSEGKFVDLKKSRSAWKKGRKKVLKLVRTR
jgi:hypothetical protein